MEKEISKLNLKSIEEIFKDKNKEKKQFDFFIPTYQRGYRWGSTQVLQLLNDILNFMETKTNNEFYPLQPIVVFKDNEKKYEIIDGQQRLTTIYIIFKYLQNILEEIASKKEELENLKNIIGICFGNIESLKNKINLPNIIYETRDKSKDFLKNLGRNSESKIYNNPDFYYMNNAYNTIKNWFINNSVNLEKFIKTLLTDVKVIWYKIEENDEKEKRNIFARLNIGKIELTNAELIRALLLNNVDDYKKKIETGNDLDKIEYSLRNDLFWYFLEEKDKDTRIDLIYELLADTYVEEGLIPKEIKKILNKKLDKKYSFYVFEYILKSNKITNYEIMENIKQYFRFVEEWFEDKEFYHKIGYLLTIKHKNIKLLNFIQNYKNKNKQEFRKYLDSLIKDSINNINIDELTYGKDNSKIKKILLLFNIQTILNNENVTYKFNFQKFKSRSDDIEHIRSQTDPDIQGKERKKWIETILKYYKYEEVNIDGLLKNDELFKKFFNKIKNEFETKESDESLKDKKDKIGNLTLLDSSVNRSYGNSFFPIKRAIILEEERKGTFIPPCTKDVFLKVYSKKINNMMEWNENDIDSYKETIKEILKEYIGEENAN